jgi:hypothetical protein
MAAENEIEISVVLGPRADNTNAFTPPTQTQADIQFDFTNEALRVVVVTRIERTKPKNFRVVWGKAIYNQACDAVRLKEAMKDVWLTGIKGFFAAMEADNVLSVTRVLSCASPDELSESFKTAFEAARVPSAAAATAAP